MANEREIYRRNADEFVSVEPRNRQLMAKEHALIDQARKIAQEAQVILPRGIECSVLMCVGNQTRVHRKTLCLPGRYRRRERVIRQFIPSHLPLRTVTNNHLVALRHKDASKGRALMDLCRLEGIAASDLYAVGDACNDRDMLDGSWGFSPAGRSLMR